MQKKLYRLSDMNYIYEQAQTVEKQQLVRLVFDSSLYYRDHVYRTPYLMPIFSHNQMILNEKRLLKIDNRVGR